ncbi:MAG: hypothetical protein ABIC82_01190 [bacterium]
MNLKSQEYKKRAEALKQFIDNKTVFQEKELLDWISQCVSLFAELKVNDEIIREFMKTFEFEIDDIMGNFNKKISPFRYDSGISSFNSNPRESGYYFGNGFCKYPSQDVYYIKLAFTASEAIIEKIGDEEHLVSKVIINSLSEDIKYKHIVSSLELMEKYYLVIMILESAMYAGVYFK